MRLIDVKTLELKEFFHKHPPYAILSHTWGSEEVTFEEYLIATDRNQHAHAQTIKRKAGFAKIMGACKRAQADGLQYVWCDTNCIDKRSSAELSEAINSMYAWYRDSVVCYAFLADVDASPGSFAKSRWFTRGWTLQELLAPSKVIFFDGHWRVLGDRKELAKTICDVTRIHIGALNDRNTIPEYSVAQRMSWAADRQTSRREDITYCLLGIFDINMPLLYGEGNKAFLRLQQEIVKMTDDQSILAWDLSDPRCASGTGILAPSPAEFRSCGSIVRDLEVKRTPYSLTNLGISVTLPTIKTKVVGVILVGLNCAREVVGKMTDVSRQGGPLCFRQQYRVWLTLVRTMYQDIYLKGHSPSSKVFLDEMYPTVAVPKIREFFLSINISPVLWQAPTEDLVLPFQRTLSIMSSGPLITIASGDYKHIAQTFKETYPFERIYIVPLKERGKNTTSHHLISSGNFCVILSILWTLSEEFIGSFFSVLVDPKAQSISQMATQKEWDCLFDIHHQHISGCCNTKRGLQSLHTRLRQTQESMFSPQGQSEHPLVWITDTPLSDLHGHPEVIVDIVFRERQRPSPSVRKTTG
ncbi:HET-domain-containing protein [Xylaria nigripes]|nr:HET-domain-containing protein [Xylaria nigripes]